VCYLLERREVPTPGRIFISNYYIFVSSKCVIYNWFNFIAIFKHYGNRVVIVF